MKKIMFISIVLSLISTVASAQTNHYPGTTGTITKTGYTYKYRNDKISGMDDVLALELYNAANPYLDVKWGYKDGTPLSFEEAMGDGPNSVYFSDSSQTKAQTLATVDGCFTAQQKNALKGKSMFIELRIDSSTGKIADVYFSFFRDSPFVNIPVETYRSVELALKQELTVTVTTQGRKMNYLQLFWSQKF